MNKAIELVNLTKFYGQSRGIENVNLIVEEGEIFGFIGPNGAGKSTTIRTLLGLIFKTSGQMSVFGMDAEKHREQILQNTGYLPSEVFYYDNMRAIDLLNYSASFYNKDCSGKIKQLAEYLELDLNKKIEDMSLGNKKKVGIVQGLLHSPKLIILDEPTSGLDPLMQQRFFELLKEENKKGATVLFSSHILSEVQKICDRVGIIKDGKMVEVKKIAELTHSSYKKIAVEFEDSDFTSFELEGVIEYKQHENSVSFLYRGDINEVLAEIVKRRIKNIDISEPTLEEIFMHHYQK